MIVDDAYTLTGTTHLWRLGPSFDSSLAVVVFDERLTGGRPQEICQFRHRLAIDAAVTPHPTPTETDKETWNRHGSPQPGFDPVAWTTAQAAAVRATEKRNSLSRHGLADLHGARHLRPMQHR